MHGSESAHENYHTIGIVSLHSEHPSGSMQCDCDAMTMSMAAAAVAVRCGPESY